MARVSYSHYKSSENVNQTIFVLVHAILLATDDSPSPSQQAGSRRLATEEPENTQIPSFSERKDKDNMKGKIRNIFYLKTL